MAMQKSSDLFTYTCASLAAITLVYVFGPTIFSEYRYEAGFELNEKPSRDGVVGLSNIANDCYINSILQALAGLNRFRTFISRELRTRESNGLEVRLTVNIPTFTTYCAP